MNTDTHVYVVDPSKPDRDALVQRLKSPVYRLESMSGGKEILRRIRKKGRQIVILDLAIRDMDPYDLINKLRKNTSGIEVITITRDSTSKIRKRVAKEGVLFHSTKPKHLYQLGNIVNVTIEFAERRAQRRLDKVVIG